MPMVALTVFVTVSITDTELDSWFATYALLPSGVNARAIGVSPTSMVAVTAFAAVSITDTVPPPAFTT